MARTVVLVALLIAAALGGAAASNDPPKSDLTGLYVCEGTNPDGTPYRGVVEIAAVEGTYLVRWTMPNDVQVLGVGLLKSSIFAVSYFGGTPAVVTYTVDGERLVGEWTMGGMEGKVFSEILTRMPKGSLKPAKPTTPETPPAPTPPRSRRPSAGQREI